MAWRNAILCWLGLKPQVVTETRYKIIEVPRPRTLSGWDKDIRASVATLSAHPGFVALTSRLAAQRALLESKLLRSVQGDLREVDFLKAGIFWSGWLLSQIEEATSKRTVQYQDALEEEAEAFKAIDATLERVGQDEVSVVDNHDKK